MSLPTHNDSPVLAVIGGTGLYALPGIGNLERVRVDTPFGDPSDDLVMGSIYGRRVCFLARHGESHSILPHRINYRANIWALHHVGVRRIVGVNAVGGMRGDMGPRSVVVPDQLIDYTHGRADSFSDVEGAAVNHVDFSSPYTDSLRRELLASALDCGQTLISEGVYGATQGPRLETVAEIVRMRRDGCDLVGMTGMPEAVLAREMDLAYASLCIVANWAAGCGPEGEPPAAEISVEEIHAHLAVATARIPPLLGRLVSRMGMD